MTFDEICLLYESYKLTLLKGNFGKPLTPGDYDNSINNYINNSVKFGTSSVEFFLGKPSDTNKGYLSLIFYLEPVPSSSIPANSFYYAIPRNTLEKLKRLGGAITNKNAEAYLNLYSNVFYYKGRPIPKVFRQDDLRAEMEYLLKVNNYFVKTYGANYSFLGDVYTMTQQSLLSRIATNLKRDKQDIINTPKYFKDWWNNL